MKNKIAVGVGGLFCVSGIFGIFEKLTGENKESIAGTIIAGLICIVIGFVVIYCGIKKPEIFDRTKKKSRNDDNGDDVYVVPGKNIYHTCNCCQSLANAYYEEMSEYEAINNGFRKCKNCDRYY